MARNRGRLIFETATVQCCFCGRFFIHETPHLCGKNFRKHKIKWLKLKQ